MSRKKPDFDADDPFNPDKVQRRVEDAAKAERVRKTFIGYREQLEKVLQTLADSNKSDADIVKIESQIMSLLLVLDKLEKRKRVTADTMLDFTAQMRKISSLYTKPSEAAPGPKEAPPTKTERVREERKARKWLSAQLDKLSDELGEDIEGFISRSGDMISSGVQTGTKAGLASILGPGAPVFMALDDLLGITSKLTKAPLFAKSAAKSVMSLTASAFSKLVDSTNKISEKREAAAEGVRQATFLDRMRSFTASPLQDLKSLFQSRWSAEDEEKRKELSMSKRMTQVMRKGFKGLKGLGGDGGMGIAAYAGAAAGLFVGALWNYREQIGKFFGEGIAIGMGKLKEWFADFKVWTDGLYNRMTTAVDALKTVLGAGVDKAKKAVSTATDAAVNTAKNAASVVTRGPAQLRFKQVQPYLQKSADKYGVDAGTLAKLAYHESGFNQMAQPGINPATGKRWSSAKGLFQPLDTTWARHGGTPGQQFDGQANADFGAKFTRHNWDKAKAFLKRDPTDGEIYLSHFLGDAGFRNFMAAAAKGGWDQPAASAMPAAASANPPVFYANYKDPSKRTPYTFRQIYSWAQKTMDKGAPYAAQMNNSRASMTSATPPPATVSRPPAPASTAVAPPGVSGPQASLVTGTSLTGDSVPMMPDDMSLLFSNIRQFVAIG